MSKELLFARFRLKIGLIVLIAYLGAVISADIYGSSVRPSNEAAQQSSEQVLPRVAANLDRDRVGVFFQAVRES